MSRVEGNGVAVDDRSIDMASFVFSLSCCSDDDYRAGGDSVQDMLPPTDGKRMCLKDVELMGKGGA